MAAGALPFSAGFFVVSIGGKAAAHCTKISGGQWKAELAEQQTGLLVKKKNISLLKLEPLKLEMGFGIAKSMVQWMRAYMEGQDMRQDIQIDACAYDGTSRSTRQYLQCQITELSFPALDASSKEMAKISMTIQAQDAQPPAPGGSKMSSNFAKAQKRVSLQSFNVNLGSLPLKNCSKVDAIKVETKGAWANVGSARKATYTPTSRSVSNLKFTINSEDIADWEKWHQTFVVDGICSEDDELTGSVVFMAPNQKDELFTIELSNVGLIALQHGDLEAGKDAISTFTVEMYVESIKFVEGQIEG